MQPKPAGQSVLCPPLENHESHTGRRMCPMRLFNSIFRRSTSSETPNRTPLALESLENRQLMSAAYYAGTGLLSVTGTAGSDKIIVTSNASTGRTTVTTNGISQSFVTGGILKVSVSTGAGDDTVSLTGMASKPSTVFL